MLFIFTVNYVQAQAQVDFSRVTNLLDVLFQDGSTYKGQEKENRMCGWGILKGDGSYILGRIDGRLREGMFLDFSQKEISIFRGKKVTEINPVTVKEDITIYNQYGKINVPGISIREDNKHNYRLGWSTELRSPTSSKPSLYFGELSIIRGEVFEGEECPTGYGIYFDLINETITFSSGGTVGGSGICFENNGNWYIFDHYMGRTDVTERSSSSSSDDDSWAGLAVVAGVIGLAAAISGGDDDDSSSGSSSSSSSSSSSFKYSVGDRVYIDFPWKTTSGDGIIGALFTNKYTLRMHFEVKGRGWENDKKGYRLYAYAAEFGYGGTWVSYNAIEGKNKAEEKAMAAANKYLYKEHGVAESNITGKR
jgi:hypothetical protein